MGNMPQTVIDAQGSRVLITGATSQIGEYLIPLLIEAGHRVTALSRSHQPEQLRAGAEWVRIERPPKRPDGSGPIRAPVSSLARLVVDGVVLASRLVGRQSVNLLP